MTQAPSPQLEELARLERDLLAFKDKQLGSIRISVDEVRLILALIEGTRLASKDARIAELEAALEPFVGAVEGMDLDAGGTVFAYVAGGEELDDLATDDFMLARAARSKTEGEKQP